MSKRRVFSGTAIENYHDPVAYTCEDGSTFAREDGTLTPNGNRLTGQWVLRDDTGKFIDFDKYRHDLAERENIELVRHGTEVL